MVHRFKCKLYNYNLFKRSLKGKLLSPPPLPPTPCSLVSQVKIRAFTPAIRSEGPVCGQESDVRWLRVGGEWGTWGAQLVKHPTLAQVMFSWFVSSSLTSGSVLTAQSLEPALDSVSPSLSAPLQLVFSLSLSLSLSQK